MKGIRVVKSNLKLSIYQLGPAIARRTEQLWQQGLSKNTEWMHDNACYLFPDCVAANSREMLVAEDVESSYEYCRAASTRGAMPRILPIVYAAQAKKLAVYQIVLGASRCGPCFEWHVGHDRSLGPTRTCNPFMPPLESPLSLVCSKWGERTALGTT
jgi:hypothetical protein